MSLKSRMNKIERLHCPKVKVPNFNEMYPEDGSTLDYDKWIRENNPNLSDKNLVNYLKGVKSLDDMYYPED